MFDRPEYVDMNHRLRCYSAHQILSFIKFHLCSCVDEHFDSIRRKVSHLKMIERVVAAHEAVLSLMRLCERRHLIIPEKIRLTRLETEVIGIIRDFHGQNQMTVRKSVFDNICMSLPCLLGSKSIDDMTLSRANSSSSSDSGGSSLQLLPIPAVEVKWKSEANISPLRRAARRKSIADFLV